MLSTSQCCGTAIYDPSSQECCESDLDPSRLFEIRTRQTGRHYRCCGHRVVDIEFEECLDWDYRFPGAELFQSKDQRVRCGTELYNPMSSQHVCCSGTNVIVFAGRQSNSF